MRFTLTLCVKFFYIFFMRWKLFFQFKNSKGQWFRTDKEDVKELNFLPFMLLYIIGILIILFIYRNQFFGLA